MGKNTNKQWDLLVIGAGASGMMTAITAARANKKVLVIEKMDKAGKKLLATGNGKCNFTNAYMSEECFGGDRTLVKKVLSQFTVEDCLEFFHSIGIYPKNKNGYYYPNSEQASAVVNALIQEMSRLSIDIVYETMVKDIIASKNTVFLETNKGSFIGKKLVIATGLLAAPKLGSDGSLFELIKGLGHRFKPILPALCGFYCKDINFKKVAGVRAAGTVTAYINDKKEAEDTGEIQFTEYGLSGIPVFQISRYLSKGLYEKANVKILINLLPDWDSEKVISELKHRKTIKKEQTADCLLNGLIHQKLSELVLEKAAIKNSFRISDLTDADLKRIASILQNITVSVTKYRDYEYAQVCTGGIPASDIDVDTLESKKVPNIFFAGEILDVDGICGGYNLHFAWATGYIVGKAAIKNY